MLRLHEYRYHRPDRLEDAVALLAAHEDALAVAGGTDLVPNMKHRLFTPRHLVGLKGIAGFADLHMVDAHGQKVAESSADAAALAIGAGVTLARVARDPAVRCFIPSLAEAAGKVAGPQIRNQGTLGGNLCLDTRCTYYNQTEFWRQSLGYCLKKDGDVCHVTRVGKKCVAAHSADTPPVLISLGASVELASATGTRTVSVDDFFVADGQWNTVRRRDEIVTRILIPLPRRGTRMAYRKVRQRNSIDFPLLSIAAAATPAQDGTVAALSLVVSALGARPRVVTGLDRLVQGASLRDAIDRVAQQAFKQCHPLENIIVDADWRRAMVPVYVRRALEEIEGLGIRD